MEMLGMLPTSWPRMLVFLWLMVRPNSLQVSAKVIISRCKAFSLCAVKAASSANSISLISTFRTLVSAQRRARLKRFPSFLVHTIFWPAKGVRQQYRKKDVQEFEYKYTALFHSALDWEGVWGWAILLDGFLHVFMAGKTLSSLGAWGGIPSSAREWITPSCWLGSKALLWSIKAIYRGFLCSAPDTFPAAASGKRSCQLLTFLPWTRTEPQGTPFLLASVTYSTLHGQRPSQWYWGEIFHGVCYSRCGVPCLLVL